MHKVRNAGTLAGVRRIRMLADYRHQPRQGDEGQGVCKPDASRDIDNHVLGLRF